MFGSFYIITVRGLLYKQTRGFITIKLVCYTGNIFSQAQLFKNIISKSVCLLGTTAGGGIFQNHRF